MRPPNNRIEELARFVKASGEGETLELPANTARELLKQIQEIKKQRDELLSAIDKIQGVCRLARLGS